jgi:hypothetical protein
MDGCYHYSYFSVTVINLFWFVKQHVLKNVTFYQKNGEATLVSASLYKLPLIAELQKYYLLI